jgi:hypothetical protein
MHSDGAPHAFVAAPQCAVCGRPATRVELVAPQDPGQQWRLIYHGLAAGTGDHGTAVSEARALLLTEAFTPPLRYPTVHRADLYDDAGFCGPCDRAYCYTHWNPSRTEYGRCPNGHGKSLDPFWTSSIDDDD